MNREHCEIAEAIKELTKAIQDNKLSASDQKLLDAILARSERITKKLERLDALTPPSAKT